MVINFIGAGKTIEHCKKCKLFHFKSYWWL